MTSVRYMIQGSGPNAFWSQTFANFSDAWMFASIESCRKGWTPLHQSSTDCFAAYEVNEESVRYFNVAALDFRVFDTKSCTSRLETHYIKIVRQEWTDLKQKDDFVAFEKEYLKNQDILKKAFCC